MPAIEAQAFGVPSVVAPNTAASEVIGNGGLICNFQDKFKLLNIVDYLIKNPKIYEPIQESN